jgi:hypothetical protein
MKKTDPKKFNSKEGIEKLKRENNKLRQENELLKGILKSSEGTS